MDSFSTSQGNTKVPVEGNTTPKQFKWTYQMESHLLELLLTEDRIGNQTGGTFTSTAYRNILCELHNTFGQCLRKNHLRNNIRTLKHSYNEFKDAFRGMNGFSWNWNMNKLDAEDDVWESLIKDNPVAASLRHKTCKHWDIMNALWSSSRAVDIKTSIARERLVRVQQQLEHKATETLNTYSDKTNNSTSRGASTLEDLRTEYMDILSPNASYSQPTGDSYRGRKKLKTNIEVILQSVGNNLSSSLDIVSRAMIESSEILAKKLKPSSERSNDLFNALLGLDLSKEYLIHRYQYLNKHEQDANMFLGLLYEFRKEMLINLMSD